MKYLLLLLLLPLSMFAQTGMFAGTNAMAHLNSGLAVSAVVSNPPAMALSVAATTNTTGTFTVTMTNAIMTIVPTAACTLNATGGLLGQEVTLKVTTSGVSAFVLTFGTNFKAQGTLSTGTVTSKIFCVTFRYDGTTWLEIARTTAM